VDEGALGEHQVELAINALEDLRNGSGVGEHGDGAVGLSKLVAGNNGRLVLVDAALETSRAPVNELDGGLVLDGEDGVSDILGDDITAVHEAAGHVLPLARITLAHHVVSLERGVGNLLDGEALAESLLRRDDRRIRAEEEVNARIGDQVGLELVDVNVELALKAERRGEAGDDLSNNAVEILVSGTLDAEVLLANVIDRLVVEHESAVGVLKEGVSGEDGVVGLNHRGGHLRGRVDAEVELRLLAIVRRETLEQERAEARARTSANGVEDEEALEAIALVSKLSNAVQGGVEKILADSVVATGVVIGRVFLATDQLIRVEELGIGTIANLVNDRGLEVDHDSTRDILARAGLGEHSLEALIVAGIGHGSIRLNAVL